MSRPRMIEGRAGTGKTLTVIAKIEQLYRDGKIDNENKVLVLTFSNHMVDHFRAALEQFLEKHFWQLGLDGLYGLDSFPNVTIENYYKSDMKEFYKRGAGMGEALKKYKYIFMDEAEDLGQYPERMLEPVISGLNQQLMGCFGFCLIHSSQNRTSTLSMRLRVHPME